MCNYKIISFFSQIFLLNFSYIVINKNKLSQQKRKKEREKEKK